MALFSAGEYCPLACRHAPDLHEPQRRQRSAAYVLVIHDELDLEPGRIKIKSGGGLAGHNGLKSIVQRLGTQDFYRLRLGVGRPPDRDNVISWVLGRFPAQEKTRAEESIKEAVEAILCFAADGPEKAANRYNGKKMASL